jgi:hypothetical protein
MRHGDAKLEKRQIHFDRDLLDPEKMLEDS